MNLKKNYKKLKSLSTICFFAIFFAAGCGDKGKSGLTEGELARIAITEKIKLVEEAGGLVLMVGGETISSDEIIQAPVEFETETTSGKSLLELFKPTAKISSLEQFKERVRPEIKEAVFSKTSQILLYQEAKKQIGSAADESLEKVAQVEMRKFILRFGGDEAQADEALKKMGMDRKSFKERRKRFILTQTYIASKLPKYRPATYRELLDYYERTKDKLFARPPMIQFRLIDIELAKLDITDPNQTSASLVGPNRLEEAKKLASQLMRRIKDGEDFAALAQQFSHDYRREFGGLWPPRNPESLASPYNILAKEAEKIQVGQVAGPIETPEHIFIMKLEEKQPAGHEPFENVQKQIEEKIFYEHRNEFINKLNAKLLEQAELGETDEFIDFCVEKIYEMARQ